MKHHSNDHRSKPKLKSSQPTPPQSQAINTTPEVNVLQLTPAAIMHIQRTYGNQAALKIVARSREKAKGVIQRTPLETDEVMSALETIPFVKDKLDKPLRGQDKKSDKDKNKKKMRDLVNRMLARYQAAFGKASDDTTSNAMMIGMALQGAARVVAEELYAPEIMPLLTKKLMQVFSNQIKSALADKQMNQSDDVLKLTEALVSDDPLSLYMHKELRIEEAARRIHSMATTAGQTPATLFKLLRERFETEMAAHTHKSVREAQDKSGSYNIKYSTGELSTDYFAELFGTQDPSYKKDNTGKVEGLNFTQEGQQKLDALQAAVRDFKPPTGAQATAKANAAGLTPKQEQHIKEVEDAEKLIDMNSIESQLIHYFVTQMMMSKAQAQNTLQTIKQGLPNLPLTITVVGEDWFGKTTDDNKPKPPDPGKQETVFKPATNWTQKKTLTEIFGVGGNEEIEFAGEYTHPKYAQERGANYLRFRNWKDRLMTSLLEFSPDEMPTFGAVNVNWETGRSSQGDKSEDFGVNYYGNTHFLLKPDQVKDRLVYTAGDHGQPRRNILMALYDFALGESYTGLKAKRDFNQPKLVASVINALTSKDPLAAATLPFEIQIFGAVDVAQHVQKIYVADAVSDTVKANLEAFKKKTGVDYEVMNKPPGGVKMKTEAQIKQDLFDRTFQQRGGDPNTLAPRQNFIFREYQMRVNQFQTLVTEANTPEDMEMVNEIFEKIGGYVDSSAESLRHDPTAISEQELQFIRQSYSDCYRALEALKNQPPPPQPNQAAQQGVGV